MLTSRYWFETSGCSGKRVFRSICRLAPLADGGPLRSMSLPTPQWDLVDDMIEAEGWVLVVLLRLSPIVPWNLLNIAMATTRMHFLSFAIASAIGALHPSLTQPKTLDFDPGFHSPCRLDRCTCARRGL